MDNYKEIRNIIHNELKITKNDIKEQIDIAIQKIVEKTVTPTLIESILEKYITQTVENSFGSSGYWRMTFKDRVSGKLEDQIGKLIAESLNITLSLNGKEVGNEEGNGGVMKLRSRVRFE